MILFVITFCAFAFVIFIMAIGVIVGNRRIKGSCGGLGGCDFCVLKHCRKERCDSPCKGAGATEGKGAE